MDNIYALNYLIGRQVGRRAIGKKNGTDVC